MTDPSQYITYLNMYIRSKQAQFWKSYYIDIERLESDILCVYDL